MWLIGGGFIWVCFQILCFRSRSHKGTLDVISCDWFLTSTCCIDRFLHITIQQETNERFYVPRHKVNTKRSFHSPNLKKPFLRWQQVRPACHLKHHHLAWINSSTNGIYLEVLGTMAALATCCNMFYCLHSWQGTPSLVSPLSHT